MPGRQYKRYQKHLSVLVRAGDKEFRAFTSDISKRGLFIKTNKSLAPGTSLQIDLTLPDETISHLKAVVRWAVKTQVSIFKNGMGVELVQIDDLFRTFFEREFREEIHVSPEKPAEERPHPGEHECIIIACPGCGVKNKVLKAKLDLHPKCGKCGSSLQA
ncbi:MAG: PilZ domain-containing protein [bacterium]